MVLLDLGNVIFGSCVFYVRLIGCYCFGCLCCGFCLHLYGVGYLFGHLLFVLVRLFVVALIVVICSFELVGLFDWRCFVCA